MIHIIDYDMGNLRSVQKALEKQGAEAVICSDPAELRAADKLILPGVGAFRDAIAALHKRDLVAPIMEHVAQDKPLLGICLGLQLLFDTSYEDGIFQGLGIIPGEVVKFKDQPELKIPHMGWNELKIKRDVSLMQGIPESSHVYFVHSYYVVPRDPNVVVATSMHGEEFTAIIQRGNLYATQFHPEKSQQIGLQLLKNFVGV